MFVSLTITHKTFKFLTLFVARAATMRGKRGGAPQTQISLPSKPKVTIVENSVSIVSAPLKEIFAPPWNNALVAALFVALIGTINAGVYIRGGFWD